LHLASRYLADCHPEEQGKKSEKPATSRVIYISTDLTHAKASEVWQDFGLVQPNLREVPFSVSGPGEAGSLHLRVEDFGISTQDPALRWGVCPRSKRFRFVASGSPGIFRRLVSGWNDKHVIARWAERQREGPVRCGPARPFSISQLPESRTRRRTARAS